MNHILKMMVMFIVAVAVYDIYCTVQLHDSIIHIEENPLALWFIESREITMFASHPRLGHDSASVTFKTVDVSRLVLVKSIGMVCSIPLMFFIVQALSVRMATWVIVPVFSGSLWLLARLVH